MIEHVRPGAVISSSFFNELIDTINELETRLGNVETGAGGASGTVIDHFEPATQVEVGQVLTMFGSFDFPPTANAVTVDGVPVPSFRPLSNNLQLLFIVPAIGTVPGGGKNVKITVQNSKGSAEKSYRVLPAVSSTVPPPSIVSVVDAQNSTGILRTNRAARITGTNFGATPAENIIRIRLQVGQTTVTYPKAGQPALIIDTSQTNTTQIVVTIPVIDEIGIGSTSPASVEVGVGSALPATQAVTIMRVP